MSGILGIGGLLSRYLLREIIKGILLAALIVGALVVLVDYVELSRRMDAEPNVTALQVLRLTLLKMPTMLEQTLPFMVLFGVMWVMFRLNRRSELVAMRVASMSAWQFAAPALLIAFSLGIIGTAALNPLATAMKTQFETERMALLEGESTALGGGQAKWFREAVDDGWVVIRAQSAIAQSATLYDVTFHYYNHTESGAPVITHRIDAKSAQLQTGSWQLDSARDIAFEGKITLYENLTIPTKIAPAALVENAGNATSLSVYALPGFIQQSREAGVAPERFLLQLYLLLCLPLILATMALIGAAFSFKLVRLGGTLRLVLLTGAAGFAFYFAIDFMQTLGTTKVLPPLVATLSIPVIVFLAGIARITILEDG